MKMNIVDKDISNKRAVLSPTKRALLEKYLRGENPLMASDQTVVSLGLTQAPLSFAQQRIWLMCQLDPHSPVYHMAYRVCFIGIIDIPALEQTLDEIVRRQQILRTSCRLSGENPIQKVLPPVHLSLPVVDLSGLGPNARDDELARLSAEEVRRSFDLSAGRPIRVKLMILGQQDHTLLLTVHHVAFDGWSLGALIREVSSLYPAFAQGVNHTLPELPIQYTDFTLWQRRQLEGGRLRRHLDYWMSKLDGFQMLQLPSDRPRPARQSFRGANFHFTLGLKLSDTLRDLSLKEGVTVFSSCLALFQILLHRYSGQSDIVLGTVVANRDVPEVSDIIGCLLNTLVIRTHVDAEAPFRAFLSQTHRDFLEAYEYRDLPFETVVEELKPDRDLGRNPLFQVAVVFHNAPIGNLKLPGLSITAAEVDLGITRFDLTLHLKDTEEGLVGWFEYSLDLFNVGTVEKMADHFRTLMERCTVQPGARLCELSMLTAAEHRQLAAWNKTEAGTAEPSRLHGLFEARAALTPDAVAVVYATESLSYRGLNHRANQLAHMLRQRGAGPEVAVALCLEAGIDMVVGLLGILKSGSAYVPIDLAYPPDRQSRILTDSGATLLIIPQGCESALSSYGTELVQLDPQQLSEQPEHNPETVCHCNNVAYLIYTSGSTGQPNGVVVSHRNAVHSTSARFDYYAEPVRGYLLLSSYAFDSSVAGIFWTLSQGGRLSIPSEEDRRNPVALARLIARERPSHLLCLPSLYGLLLEQAEPEQLASLKVAIVAGEACSTKIVADHYAQMSSVRLFNEYGPTEGTVWSSVYEFPPTDAGSGKPVPIGRPINNTRIYLLDCHLNLVPVGVTGELYISGAGITRGYHGQARLTAERFVPDTFAVDAGSRMYKTGDLACYREGGEIEFLGRADHQVKIRGYRIEVGEIEVRLTECRDIKEAAVLVRENDLDDKRIAAYLLLRHRTGITLNIDEVTESVRSELKTVLPEYMIPTAYVVLEALPRLPNGKVDRKALPAPERGHSLAVPFVAPRNATEKRLAELWGEVLDMKPIGLRDHFFDVGGHSMLAVQLMFMVRKTFGVEIPLRLLFERPTLEAQARLLDGDPSLLDDKIVSPICWELEAKLDPDITPGPIVMPITTPVESVLLTGATGFLGVFLLRDLIRETDAYIYCLVRTDPVQDPATRLGQALERYQLTDIARNPRIIPLRGNLSQPLLGLSADRFEHLSGEIDAIYHNGAAVDFTASYETHKPPNVIGTCEVLRLACGGKPKVLHYVSTVSIFGEYSPSQLTGFAEEDFPPGNEKLTGGYAQSKWVAEAMVRVAAGRGLPVTIHRPSNIFGDSSTGVWNTGDFYCRMIKGYVELGMAPDIDAPLDLVPVDYVSKAIVFLSGRPDLLGKTFHLTASKPIHSNTLVNIIREFGYPIQRVPVKPWIHDVTARVTAQSDHVLYPLLPLFEEWQGRTDKININSSVNRYDCLRTIEILRDGNIDHPSEMKEPIRVALSYLVKIGFIPSPKVLAKSKTVRPTTITKPQ